jgi:hypothetical protein
MKIKILKDLIARVDAWPKTAQQELVQIANEIESELGNAYRASSEEIKGIDRGLQAARNNDIATPAEITAALAKFRRA